MINRGNTSSFIDSMTNENVWKEFYLKNLNDKGPTYKIKLRNGEYLSNYKDYFI